MIDDTAGYQLAPNRVALERRRRRRADGAALAWNLVSGINDPPAAASARSGATGVPAEAAPVSSPRTSHDHRFRRRRSALPPRGRTKPSGQPPDPRERLPRALRHLLGHAARRRRAGQRPRRDGASPRPLVGRSACSRWRLSSASSSFECIAPISSRSGSVPAATISTARSTSTSPARRSSSALTSSSTSGSSASAVTEGIIDGKAQRLLIASGPELAIASMIFTSSPS